MRGKKVKKLKKMAAALGGVSWKRLRDAPDGILVYPGYAYGFNPSACQKCSGRCCKGDEGAVWLTQEEIRRIEDHTKGSVDVKITRKGLHLNMTKEGCPYLKKDGNCSIYPVRPQQCRLFPFWPNLKYKDKVINHCPGTWRLFRNAYGG